MKRDQTYLKLVKTPKIEWCNYVETSGKQSNRFVQFMLDVLRNAIPKMFAKCPRTYGVNVVNMKVSEKYVAFLPQTEYKFSTVLNYPERKASFTIELDFEIF